MDHLKRLRTEKGLSQAKLAALADVDPSTVNQIERGAREASPATLRKLADALDVSIAELLEDAAPKASRLSPYEPTLLNGLAEERPSSASTATTPFGFVFAKHYEGLAEMIKRSADPGEIGTVYGFMRPLLESRLLTSERIDELSMSDQVEVRRFQSLLEEALKAPLTKGGPSELETQEEHSDRSA
jgi:transcriptional regulator with XRE-family HTH domain